MGDCSGREEVEETTSSAPKVYFWSDHNSLQWMRKQPDPRGKFSRRILELEAINYEVIFRKGSEDAAADFISRSKSDTEHAINDEEQFLERHIYTMTETEPKPGMSFEWVRMTQRKDTEVADALSQLATGDEVVKGKFANVKGLHVNNGGLWKGSRLVVPKEICNDIISIVHGNTHAGIQQTYHEIRKRCWWKGMRNKRAFQLKERLSEFELALKSPRMTVAYDVATLPWSSDHYRYVLIMVDMFSKFVEEYP